MQCDNLQTQTEAPRHMYIDGETDALCQRPILHRCFAIEENTMRDAHLSIWAASVGAELIWRDSGLHGLCQLSCLQIHLTPLPAPSTRLSQTCCQEVYHKENVYLLCSTAAKAQAQHSSVRHVCCHQQSKTLVTHLEEYPMQLCKLAQLHLQHVRQTRHTQQHNGVL